MRRPYTRKQNEATVDAGCSMMIGIMFVGGRWQGSDAQRAEVPPAQQWRLEDLYPSDQAWKQAKDELAGRLDGILAFKGTLTQSAAQLLSCLQLNSEISKELGRLARYASMKSDQDTRNATYLALKQEIEQLVTEYSTKASFIEPEIVTLDKADDRGIHRRRAGPGGLPDVPVRHPAQQGPHALAGGGEDPGPDRARWPTAPARSTPSSATRRCRTRRSR